MRISDEVLGVIIKKCSHHGKSSTTVDYLIRYIFLLISPNLIYQFQATL